MAVDPQETWRDYFSRKRNQRMQEAAGVWQMLISAGANEGTVIAVDFVHIAPKRDDIESLARQLSENYSVTVSPGTDGYWLLNGTTRPNGVMLTQEQHLAWVTFMCDVGQSHGCVFSTWTLEAPSLGAIARSESIESDS